MRIRAWIALTAALLAAPAAAEDMCASPEASCGRLLSPACLGRLGAGSQGVDAAERSTADCDNQFATYRECLATVAANCSGRAAATPAPSAACPPDTETRLWDAVKTSNDPDYIAIFVETCPHSPFARLAERRIAALTRPAQQPPSQAAISPPEISPPAISPPVAAQPSAAGGANTGQSGFRAGVYVGKSINLVAGGVGDTTLTIKTIDPATNTAEAHLAWTNGLFGQGQLRGRALADGWLILSGPINSGITGGWTVELKAQPPDVNGAVFGEYYLTPLGQNPNGHQTGRFELRRRP